MKSLGFSIAKNGGYQSPAAPSTTHCSYPKFLCKFYDVLGNLLSIWILLNIIGFACRYGEGFISHFQFVGCKFFGAFSAKLRKIRTPADWQWVRVCSFCEVVTAAAWVTHSQNGLSPVIPLL